MSPIQKAAPPPARLLRAYARLARPAVVAKYSVRARFRGSDRAGNRPLISPRVCWGVTPLTNSSTAHHRVNTGTSSKQRIVYGRLIRQPLAWRVASIDRASERLQKPHDL